jgi:hypothetical protein
VAQKRQVTEQDFRAPEFQHAKVEDYEFREDGKLVRKDRWQRAVQSIQVLVYDKREWEISDVIARVRELALGFQTRVENWFTECFDKSAGDRTERADRFLEEAIEMLQAAEYPKKRIYKLIDHVYGRPIGELHQEVGAVMLTLATFCLAHELDMHEAGDTELERVSAPEMITRLRAKHKASDPNSPLPGQID